MNWIKKPQLFLIGLFLLIGCAPEKNITHVHKHEKAENQLIDKSNGIKTPTDVIDSNKEVGTQVGGDYSGGAIDLMSSRFEVEQAIEEARKYFIETNLFYRIYKSQLFNARADKTLKQAFDVFINKDHYNGKVSYLKEIPLEEQYSIEVVKKTKIKLLDNLVCNIHNSSESKENQLREGCVTKLNTNGEIHLNFTQLTYTSPSLLLRKMIILLAHEYTHIFGFEEKEAMLVHNFFNDHINQIMMSSEVSFFAQMSHQLSKISEEVEKAQRNIISSNNWGNYTDFDEALKEYMNENNELNVTSLENIKISLANEAIISAITYGLIESLKSMIDQSQKDNSIKKRDVKSYEIVIANLNLAVLVFKRSLLCNHITTQLLSKIQSKKPNFTLRQLQDSMFNRENRLSSTANPVSSENNNIPKTRYDIIQSHIHSSNRLNENKRKIIKSKIKPLIENMWLPNKRPILYEQQIHIEHKINDALISNCFSLSDLGQEYFKNQNLRYDALTGIISRLNQSIELLYKYNKEDLLFDNYKPIELKEIEFNE